MGFFKDLDVQIKEQQEKQEKLRREIDKKAELVKAKEDTKKMFYILKKIKLIDTKKRWESIKAWFYPSKIFLIHMELSNGFHVQFVTPVSKGSFKYQGAEYIIDDSFKYYDMAAKLWCLDYHQELSIPIKRQISIKNIKKAIEIKGITDVDTAINPITLRQFIESEVIQKVMAGAEMDKALKTMRIMIIITLISSLISTLILIKTTGMLDNLHL